MKPFKNLTWVALALIPLALGACTKSEEKPAGEETKTEATKPAEEKKLELVYVEWSSEVASTNVVRAVLQEKLGYQVELTPVSAAAMWQAVASGDADGMVAAWLPTTHGQYLERFKGKVEDLGANLNGTRIGLVVPGYVKDVESIGDLETHAKEFDGKIIGIDPGAGIMSKTEQAMKDYDLKNLELVSGSGATMTAALADAIQNKQPIVITGWTPHWMWARWDGLRYLKDPKNVYGGEEEIDTVVRKGLKADHPEAYAFLDAFHWTPADMAQVMVMNQENDNPYENAKKWVAEHPELVNGWLKGAEGETAKAPTEKTEAEGSEK